MTFPRDARDRMPRGDKNRRIALGVDRDAMAAQAGVSTEQLHDYEFTQPDKHFDLDVAPRTQDCGSRGLPFEPGRRYHFSRSEQLYLRDLAFAQD